MKAKINKKCKFSNKCKLFSKNSYTCNNGGGRYCGKWREKELKETLN